MASIHEYLNQTQVVWQQFNHSRIEHVAVTELWRNNVERSNSTGAVHQTVSKQELPNWLRRTNGAHEHVKHASENNCLLRAVWLPSDTKSRIIDVDVLLFEEICTAIGHKLAQTYCKTQYAGIDSIVDPDTGITVYFLCNHPKLAVTWSKCPASGVTSMICVADRRKLDILQKMMESQFLQDLAHHEMTPALMSALLSSKEIDIETCEVKGVVREVEVRTGFHEWRGRAEDSAGGDLVGLSAKMSGCGARVESNARKLGVIAGFNHFIRDHLEEARNGRDEEELMALNSIVERRTAMQALDLKYTISRIRTQKEAVSLFSNIREDSFIFFIAIYSLISSPSSSTLCLRTTQHQHITLPKNRAR
jgi:hypothetical protein